MKNYTSHEKDARCKKSSPRIQAKMGPLNLIFQKQKWRPNNMARLDPDSQILSETMSDLGLFTELPIVMNHYSKSVKLSKLLTDL